MFVSLLNTPVVLIFEYIEKLIQTKARTTGKAWSFQHTSYPKTSSALQKATAAKYWKTIWKISLTFLSKLFFFFSIKTLMFRNCS